MSDRSGDVVTLMETMTLAPGAGYETPDKREFKDREALVAETQKLVVAARELLEQAVQVQALNKDKTLIISQHLTALKLLMSKSEEIAGVNQAMMTTTIGYVVAKLFSSADGNHDASGLLSHFRSTLESIIEAFLENTTVDQNVLLKIFEDCYGKSLSSSGDLHVHNYFDPLYEAALCSPYDPDFEAEQYYDHEDRLQTDAAYAQAESLRQQGSYEDRAEREKRKHQAWIKFWTRALNRCTGGPTLFWPLAFDGFGSLPDVPRYLFRAFDPTSSGDSNDEVVRSPASKYMDSSISRNDLLSLERKFACEKLCAHLSKDCFGTADCADNLMSWSSSLLFVIQYAFWRCHHGRHPHANVKICMVDTTKFPRGQFARDLWLLKKFHKSADECPKMRKVMRLRETGFDNGEYFSQGTLNHKQKSWVVTLDKMIQSGLYDLCPEFETGSEQWTKRVHELRSTWANLHLTTRNELQVAIQITRTCFQGARAFDLAILLLTLKNREYQGRSKRGRWRWTGTQPHDQRTKCRLQIHTHCKGTILSVSQRTCRDT
jgi:hypothetical protein